VTTTRRRQVERLALSKAEAAEALGVSVDHLERHVLDHLHVVYVGARRLIPVAELQRFLREQAVPISPVSRTDERHEVAANARVRATRGPVGGPY
jgi:hypothetical protein